MCNVSVQLSYTTFPFRSAFEWFTWIQGKFVHQNIYSTKNDKMQFLIKSLLRKSVEHDLHTFFCIPSRSHPWGRCRLPGRHLLQSSRRCYVPCGMGTAVTSGIPLKIDRRCDEQVNDIRLNVTALIYVDCKKLGATPRLNRRPLSEPGYRKIPQYVGFEIVYFQPITSFFMLRRILAM